MPANEHLLARVAAAILDGTPIDWAALASAANAADRPLLEELRLLYTVADLHRNLPQSDGARDAGSVGGAPPSWGRLRLIERVGGGAFGDVYRAWDPRLQREVALKVIPAPGGPESDHSAAILQEGRLAARVRHPGVVTIYDVELRGSEVGLCMEFVEGATVEQRLARQGVFGAAEAVQIGVQLCDALSAAHDAGVLHRDIKGANVIIRADGRVVLMDFGAGRRLDDVLATERTGTPLYLAPEVLHGEEATVRSDVYSLGVLLYRMLTGSYPVPAQTLPELRAAHSRRMSGEPAARAATLCDVPGRLAAVIERAIDPRPDRRYEQVMSLAADLRDGRAETERRPFTEPACWIVADTQVRLSEGVNILGRDPEASVWCDRPGVSRLHARIVVTAGEATLEDIGSRNGTWLRGERVVSPMPLRDGDDIRLGPLTVTFRVRRGAESTETAQ